MEVVTNTEVVHFYIKRNRIAVDNTVELHVIVKDHMLHLGHVVEHF